MDLSNSKSKKYPLLVKNVKLEPQPNQELALQFKIIKLPHRKPWTLFLINLKLTRICLKHKTQIQCFQSKWATNQTWTKWTINIKTRWILTADKISLTGHNSTLNSKTQTNTSHKADMISKTKWMITAPSTLKNPHKNSLPTDNTDKSLSLDHKPDLHTQPKSNQPLRRKRLRCQWAIGFSNNHKEKVLNSMEKRGTERRKVWVRWVKKTTPRVVNIRWKDREWDKANTETKEKEKIWEKMKASCRVRVLVREGIKEMEKLVALRIDWSRLNKTLNSKREVNLMLIVTSLLSI